MNNLPVILSLFTLGAVLLIAIVSYLRARKAQKDHKGSAAEPRLAAEAAEAADPDTNDGSAPWSQQRANNPPRPSPPVK